MKKEISFLKNGNVARGVSSAFLFLKTTQKARICKYLFAKRANIAIFSHEKIYINRKDDKANAVMLFCRIGGERDYYGTQ